MNGDITQRHINVLPKDWLSELPMRMIYNITNKINLLGEVQFELSNNYYIFVSFLVLLKYEHHYILTSFLILLKYQLKIYHISKTRKIYPPLSSFILQLYQLLVFFSELSPTSSYLLHSLLLIYYRRPLITHPSLKSNSPSAHLKY